MSASAAPFWPTGQVSPERTGDVLDVLDVLAHAELAAA
jgi:hypothetical protein